MTRWVFYLPFAYFLSTRIVTAKARISWMMIYFVPLLLILLCFLPDVQPEHAVQLLLATTCTYVVYELGYIENDTVTIRHEQEPTLRLDDLQQEYIADYWLVILLVRLTIAAGLLSYLLASPGAALYVGSLLCLALIFPLYNRRRSSVNAALHPLLVTARYCGPLLLLMPDPMVFAFGLLMFPVVNGLERAAEPRYQLRFMQQLWFANGDSGRWGYYLVASVVWLWVCFAAGLDWLTVVPLLYMFFYRMVSPRLVRARA